MKLTVLGSGSYLSGSNRNTAGYLIEENQEKIVIDLGIGCLKNLQKITDLEKIDKLFFTHIHPDHVADLAEFFFLRRGLLDEKFSNKKTQINIYGPKGFSEFFEKLKETFPAAFQLEFPIKVIELWNSKTKTYNFTFKSKPVDHPDAIGYRIETKDKVFAYSGDSGYCEELVELCKDADLSLLECTMPDDREKKGHLNPVNVAKIGKVTGTKKLLLTHLTPMVEKEDIIGIVNQTYNGKVELAIDLGEYEI